MHGLMASKNIRERLAADSADPRLASEIEAFQQTDLEPHFQAEEALMDVLEGRWGAADVDLTRTRREHAQLRGWSVSGLPQDMAAFGELLGDHIRYEEEVLFNRFEATLSEEEVKVWSERLQSVVSPNPLIPPPPRH
jgi:hypothetical protein